MSAQEPKPGAEDRRHCSSSRNLSQNPAAQRPKREPKISLGGWLCWETPIADVGKDSTDVQMDGGEKNSELSEEFMAEFSKSRVVKETENTSLVDSDTTTAMQSAESHH